LEQRSNIWKGFNLQICCALSLPPFLTNKFKPSWYFDQLPTDLVSQDSRYQTPFSSSEIPAPRDSPFLPWVSYLHVSRLFRIIVFQGLGLLACSGSDFIFLKLMNLLDNW
jgi:hypothetical protein